MTGDMYSSIYIIQTVIKMDEKGVKTVVVAYRVGGFIITATDDTSLELILPIPCMPLLLPRHPTLVRALRRYHYLDNEGNVLYGAAEYLGEDVLWYFFLTKAGWKWFRTDLGVKAARRELVAGAPE
jgi:hypothetical protein